jgi:PAS domain S-box-containing protein
MPNSNLTATNFHRLLNRQIYKSLPTELANDPRLQNFLESVSQAYCQFQEDLGRAEHVLEESSNELFESNRKLSRLAEKKTEEAASSSRLLEEVVSSISEVLVQVDKNGTIIYLNKAWETVTGYKISESLNKNWKDFLTSSTSRKKIALAFGSGAEFVDGTVKILTAEKSEKWLGVSLRHHISAENEHVGYIGTFMDVTARKKQEEQINQLVEWFNESSEAVQVTDEWGKLVFVNHEAARRLGKNPKQIIGSHISTVEKIFEDEETWRNYVEELKRVPKMIVNGVHKRYDGTSYPVEISVKYYASHGNGYVLAFIRDISERVVAERKLQTYMRDLEKINAELDQFAYVVSHDLKAPLRAINNLSEWIEEDIGDIIEGDTKEQFRLLRGRVHRMESLINGILSYSRAGRIKPVKEQFLVKNVVDDLCENFSSKKPVDFRIKGDNHLKLISEKIALIQILQNLISNGIKYNDKTDIVITIGWTERETEVDFYVTDNGPGISPEFHDKIFIIFQTLQSRDEIESTGVGLAIVKKIVDEKGGTIGVKSTMNEGTTFHFSWPKDETTGFDDFEQNDMEIYANS